MFICVFVLGHNTLFTGETCNRGKQTDMPNLSTTQKTLIQGAKRI